jgi:zinc-binding alcohol dehydrogenase family protein
MKAFVYEKAHSLADFAIHLADVEEPALRDQEVLVEVRVIGVNPGEASIRGIKSAEPGGRVLLGWEFAGVVVGIGPAVERFRVGDRVFGTGDMTRDGAWAERVAVDHRVVAHVPDQLSFTDAASLPIGAVTAWEAVFRDQDRLAAGVDRIHVLGGAGAVGSLATQFLKARTKATVISTGSRSESRDWCKRMGAHLVLDHSADIAEQLAKTGIPHVDCVLSTAKSADNINWIANVLRPFGRLCVVDGGPPLDVHPLVPKAASLHMEMVFGRIIYDREPEWQARILATVASLVVEGRVKPIATTLLDGLTAETMKAAHELVESGRTVGKVVTAI